MNITDFITELFCQIDDALPDVARHSQAILSLSELVTIGVLQAMKNVSQRAFYHWLRDNYSHLFPPPLADHTVSGLTADCGPSSTGPATSWPNPPCWGWPTATVRLWRKLRHPVREGRRPGQIGKKGKSNHRWIVGGKLCVVLNKLGLVADWDCANSNVHDQAFQPLLAYYDGQMIILADTGFHRAKGDPANVKICRRGQWNVRMIVETVFSMMSVVWRTKEMRHRVWDGFEAHLAYTVAAFNILAQWNGLQPDDQGIVRLSIAKFTL